MGKYCSVFKTLHNRILLYQAAIYSVSMVYYATETQPPTPKHTHIRYNGLVLLEFVCQADEWRQQMQALCVIPS